MRLCTLLTNRLCTFEDLALRMLSLRGVFCHERQVARHERPFVVGHITRITCSCHISESTILGAESA